VEIRTPLLGLKDRSLAYLGVEAMCFFGSKVQPTIYTLVTSLVAEEGIEPTIASFDAQLMRLGSVPWLVPAIEIYLTWRVASIIGMFASVGI
jgi:hypothetical protein